MSISKDEILRMYPNTNYYIKNSNGGLLGGTKELDEAKKMAEKYKKEYLNDSLNKAMEVFVYDKNKKEVYKATGKSKTTIIKYEVTTKEQLEKLYLGSALTFMGLDDSDKNLISLSNWIKEYSEVSEPLNMFLIKGNVMNREYGLTEKNRYPDNYSIVCVELKDIKDVKKIIIPRFQVNGRWFDDVVNNDRFRQDQIDGIDDEEEY